MSIIKSFSVGDGDMFYIKHGSDNFTLIDCYLSDENRDTIIAEIKAESKGKGITRFISTHPDDDHIGGLDYLDNEHKLHNFYCVSNNATKSDKTVDFDKYCSLRDDSKKAFYIFRGCTRKWMNKGSEERGSSGINILWPNTKNEHYISALKEAKEGKSPNNISPIIKYSMNDGVSMLWMGDLETAFMDKIIGEFTMDTADILFAPHHGRESGKVPQDWLDEIDPQLIIIGEAPSKNLTYYNGYNTITQNTAGDITFECDTGYVHIYVSNKNYSVNFLENKNKSNTYGNYIGSLCV